MIAALLGRVPIATVLEHVAFETDRRIGDIVGRGQRHMDKRARYAAVWLARRHSSKSAARIATAFEARNHSTISYQIRRAEALRMSDADFRMLTDVLDQALDAAA